MKKYLFYLLLLSCCATLFGCNDTETLSSNIEDKQINQDGHTQSLNDYLGLWQSLDDMGDKYIFLSQGEDQQLFYGSSDDIEEAKNKTVKLNISEFNGSYLNALNKDKATVYSFIKEDKYGRTLPENELLLCIGVNTDNSKVESEVGVSNLMEYKKI
ncbi:hypothetical protein [Enterococcus sp. LJL90]